MPSVAPSTFLAFWRWIMVLSHILHAIIFTGVFLEGLVILTKPIITVDYLYALLFTGIGFVALMIITFELKRLLGPKLPRRWIKRWQRDKPKVAIATIMFVLIYTFRAQTNGMILFIGFELGRFFIRTASNAYEILFGFDLDNIRFYLVAWLFQWHFLFAIIGLAEAIGRKVVSWFPK